MKDYLDKEKRKVIPKSYIKNCSAKVLALFLLFTLLCALSCSPPPIEQDQFLNTVPPTDSAAKPQAPSQPRKGGTLRLHSYKPDTLCPILTINKHNMQILNLIYEGLVICENNLTVTPSLAESWTTPDNGLTWNITIRDGVKWHDGSPFTAADVDFTVKTIKSSGADNPYYQTGAMISKTKISGNTITFTLKKPQANFINMLYFPIIKQGNINKDNFTPIGTGAYVYSAHNENNELNLTRNPSWWNGTAYVDNIIVKVSPDKTTSEISSLGADVTIIDDVNRGGFAGGTEKKNVEYPSANYTFLGFNLNNTSLAQQEVRQAVHFAIDKSRITDNILYGHAKTVNAPINPAWELYTPRDETGFYNVSRAKQTLIDSGWSLKNNVWEKEGKELSFNILVNDENMIRGQVADLIRKNLGEINITVNVEKVPFEEYTKRIGLKNYDLFLGEYSFLPNLDFSFMLGSAGSLGYKDPEMDEMLKKMTDEPSSVKENFAAFQDMFNERLPCIGLYFSNRSILVNTSVGGDLKPDFFNSFGGIGKVFL